MHGLVLPAELPPVVDRQLGLAACGGARAPARIGSVGSRELADAGSAVALLGHDPLHHVGRAGERAGYVVGLALLASGVVHGIIHLVEGSAWAGTVSWRKPTAFGLSFGLTLLCLTWVTARLGLGRRRTNALIGTLVLASILEVGIITLQQWRGVPSHFNRSTPLDTALFLTTGVGIIVMATAIVLIAVCALRRLDASPVVTSAARPS